jgi:methionyl-tRNA formyltransferase
MKVDLFLGGTLGGWVLESADLSPVARVFAGDAATAQRARARGLAVVEGDPAGAPPAGAPRALSVHYPRILPAAVLARYRASWNLHPALLPHGRGWFPVFWALWEGTPAGATLHEMVARVDAGPIVAQREVPVRPDDTGGSLHARVAEAEKELFAAFWPAVARGEVAPGRPPPAGGSYHARAEFEALKRGAGWQEMPARDLVRLVRCLTFPGHGGLELDLGGTRFEVRLAPL